YFAEPVAKLYGRNWGGILPSQRIWFFVVDPQTGQLPNIPDPSCITPMPAFTGATSINATQSALQSGSISGIVVEDATGQPIANVWVHISGSPIGKCTDAQGNYTILNLPLVGHRIQAQPGTSCGSFPPPKWASGW